jgi:hypothetical protein
MPRSSQRLAPWVVAATAAAAMGACDRGGRPSPPASLDDQSFWSLSASLSEPSGEFSHSDNLVSNEGLFPHTVRLLSPSGGVYVGVGPEQNFSYIARLRPAMAFIVDIRRENLNLHLMYKALFELSADRAGFVSRLFSRHAARSLDARSSVDEIFAAIAGVAPDSVLRDATRRAVRERLVDTHQWPLTAEDLQWIEHALDAFFSDGPGIHYGRSRENEMRAPSYQALMTATDIWGEARSYLASEDAFRFVKDLHGRNLIVPIVGDFSGPRAIRAVGDYVRQRGSVVTAFYASNVEVYLTRLQAYRYCVNLASLPVGRDTVFIGSRGRVPMGTKLETCAMRPGGTVPSFVPPL